MDFANELSDGGDSRHDLGSTDSVDRLKSAEEAHRRNANGFIKLLESTELVDGLWSELHEKWFDEAEGRLVIPEVVLGNWDRLSKYMSFGTTALELASSLSSSPTASSRSTSTAQTSNRRRPIVQSVDIWRKVMQLRRSDFKVDKSMEDLSHLSLKEMLDGHGPDIPILNLRAGRPWRELPKYMGRLNAQNVMNHVRLVVVRLAIHNAITSIARERAADLDLNQAPKLTRDRWKDFIAKHWGCRIEELPDDGAGLLRWIRIESKIAFRYHFVVSQVRPVGYVILLHLVANQLVTDNQFRGQLALTTETGQKGLQFLRSLNLEEVEEVEEWSAAIEAWCDEMCLALRS